MPNLSEMRQITEFTADAADLWQWAMYGIQGVLIVSANLLIVLAFCKHTALQIEKEYILLSGLALADLLDGLAYTLAGFRRAVLVVMDRHNEKVSAWDCFLTGHNTIWMFSQMLQPLMLLTLCTDRLLSGIIGVSVSYYQPSDGIYPRVCYSEYVAPNFVAIQYMTTTSFLVLGVTFYGIVWLLYKRLFSNALVQVDFSKKDLRQRAKNQQRLTVSLAISSLFTFVLCVIPLVVNTIITHYFIRNHVLMSVSVVLWMVTNVNPMLNVVIYLQRLRHMRQGIHAMLICKQLPINIDMW